MFSRYCIFTAGLSTIKFTYGILHILIGYNHLITKIKIVVCNTTDITGDTVKNFQVFLSPDKRETISLSPILPSILVGRGVERVSIDLISFQNSTVLFWRSFSASESWRMASSCFLIYRKAYLNLAFRRFSPQI